MPVDLDTCRFVDGGRHARSLDPWCETHERSASRCMECALARAEKAEAQLPEGMERCTLLFRECPLGHGWLTATNWVDFPCPTCRLTALTAERDALRAGLVWCLERGVCGPRLAMSYAQTSTADHRALDAHDATIARLRALAAGGGR